MLPNQAQPVSGGVVVRGCQVSKAVVPASKNATVDMCNEGILLILHYFIYSSNQQST